MLSDLRGVLYRYYRGGPASNRPGQCGRVVGSTNPKPATGGALARLFWAAPATTASDPGTWSRSAIGARPELPEEGSQIGAER